MATSPEIDKPAETAAENQEAAPSKKKSLFASLRERLGGALKGTVSSVETVNKAGETQTKHKDSLILKIRGAVENITGINANYWKRRGEETDRIGVEIRKEIEELQDAAKKKDEEAKKIINDNAKTAEKIGVAVEPIDMPKVPDIAETVTAEVNSTLTPEENKEAQPEAKIAEAAPEATPAEAAAETTPEETEEPSPLENLSEIEQNQVKGIKDVLSAEALATDDKVSDQIRIKIDRINRAKDGDFFSDKATILDAYKEARDEGIKEILDKKGLDADAETIEKIRDMTEEASREQKENLFKDPDNIEFAYDELTKEEDGEPHTPEEEEEEQLVA